MKKFAWLILTGFVLTILSSCVVAGPAVAPPPLKREMRPPRPGTNYVWISGHWKWSAGKYTWVPGYWTKKRPGKVWVPGHWTKRGRTWVWMPGHWR